MIDDERTAEVERVYAGYARSRRMRRKWDAANAGNGMIRDELAAAALGLATPAVSGSAAVLDVGCGTGWWLHRLAAAGIAPDRLHGVDLLQQRVEAARCAVPGATIRQADARALPHPSDEFALVTAITVLSSIPGDGDPARALSEMWRVLSPGGVLVVYEPRVANPLNRHTVHVGGRLVRSLPVTPEIRTLTVVPALARRLGAFAPQLYPKLARVRALRTHRLAAWAKPAA